VNNAATTIDDVDQWELLLKRGATRYEHIPLQALPKKLSQRGEPVDGWLHFAVDTPESDLYRSTLRLKVNSVHGTCVGEINGGHAFPNRGKGTVRKIGSYSQYL